MKNKIKVWIIITIIAAVVSIGLIISSMFIDMPRLLTVGLAVLVLANVSSMHVRCLKKKENS